MKNVLEVANTLAIGGTEKMMQIFCKYLDKELFNVYACGFFSAGPRQKPVSEYAKEVVIADSKPAIVIDFIKSHSIDILHWHGIIANKGPALDKIIEILTYCKKSHIRTVETSPFSLYNAEKDNLIDTRLFVSQINLLKFLVNNKKGIVSKDKYYYMYNPIDVEELSKHELTQESVREKRKALGISFGDYVLGKVGRADLWKWDDAILKVVPLLQKKIPNLKVLIRSIPPQKLAFIKQMGLGSVVINLPETSSEKEICETYQMMDVYFHTSRIGECHSSSINEAMFFGKPVITNSTDFLAATIFDRDNGQIEMVKNGENGYVENDLHKMAEKVIRLYTDSTLYNKISENNKAMARRLFDPKTVTLKLEKIFLDPKFERDKKIITMEQYNKLVVKESLLDLIRINVSAAYDKLRYLR